MRSAAEIETRDCELGRFDDFVAGRRPAKTALLDVLAE
jgi:hypothetical protein